MASEWVKKYMDLQRGKSNRRADELSRMSLAEAGAPAVFRALAKCVERDVQMYHKSGGNEKLVCIFVPSEKFVVRKPEFPAVELTVSLNLIFIEYAYWFRESHADDKRQRSGQLRILSNPSGGVQVFKNGEAYKDESDVSKFLLTPVFEYVDGSQ
jgi:hypothetical protein